MNLQPSSTDAPIVDILGGKWPDKGCACEAELLIAQFLRTEQSSWTPRTSITELNPCLLSRTNKTRIILLLA